MLLFTPFPIGVPYEQCQRSPVFWWPEESLRPSKFCWVLGRREMSLAGLLIFSLSCSMPLSICPSHPQTITFVISWWQCFLCLCHSAPAQLWLVEESYLSSWSSRFAMNGNAGPKISQQVPPCLGYMSQWSLDQWPPTSPSTHYSGSS